MRNHIDPKLSLIGARGLRGLIDVDQGPTDDQLAVLSALGQYLLGLDPGVAESLRALSPREAAARLGGTPLRRPFTQMAIILELCRHPPSETQLQQLEKYCDVLDMSGPELDGVRAMAHESAKEATDDFLRVFKEYMPALSEPRLLEASSDPDLSAEPLWAQIGRFGEEWTQANQDLTVSLTVTANAFEADFSVASAVASPFREPTTSQLILAVTQQQRTSDIQAWTLEIDTSSPNIAALSTYGSRMTQRRTSGVTPTPSMSPDGSRAKNVSCESSVPRRLRLKAGK